MHKELGRYIEIDRMIRGGEHPRKEELARLFGVNARTITRYMKTMREHYGAPIEIVPGKGGYRYSNPFWFLPALGINAKELFTLALAGELMRRYEGTPFYEHIMGVRDRLLRIGDRDGILRGSESLLAHVSFSVQPGRSIGREQWESAFGALWTRKALQFDYPDMESGHVKRRSMEIWHIFFWEGDWYLVGQDRSLGELRAFALSRLSAPKILMDEPYGIPDDFRLCDWLDPEMGPFLSSEPPRLHRIRFDASAAPFVRQKHWHSSQRIVEEAGGTVVLSFQTNQFKRVVSWVLEWGASATVLEPPELVQAVAEQARAMAKRYSE